MTQNRRPTFRIAGDAGTTYHGFPYHGRLPNQMVEQLRTMALNKNCLDGFEKWLKYHIQR